jgi:multidrug efflux pump subunit AcrA (membrane-fusion protein)
MIARILIPMLSVAGFLMGLYMVAQGSNPVIPAQPVAPPPLTPFRSALSGTGIVESSSGNVQVATPVSGLVTEMLVEAGDRVKAGDPLFRLDDRTHRAELEVREAAVAVAEAQLADLLAMPRAEDIPPAEARVTEAQSLLADAEENLRLAQAVEDRRAISAEELSRRQFAVAGARARLATAEAELLRIKAGAFAPEIAIAKARVQEAKAHRELARTELDRLTIKAPVTGKILARNLYAGEFAVAGPTDDPLLLIGETDTLYVRVDIDENDAWRFSNSAPAKAYLRGNKEFFAPITYVRTEPYVVPKRSLTGEATERVDTRVLQILYSFPATALPVQVGQLMDVYVEDSETTKEQASK